MFIKSTLLFVLLLLASEAFAQTSRLEGRIVDGKTKAPLSGAHLKITNQDDPRETSNATTGTDGVFIFSGIGFHNYLLDVTYVGRLKLSKTIRVDNSTMTLGDLMMSESPIVLGEVVIEGDSPPAVQKNDTTEFSAKAYKTHPDADAGDLLAKMPGITVDNGSVKAQGEDVQQVLVDGKPFFGSDPTLALRNLPADAVDKIQVFDKMSDQAEFTGFDDGQSIKTINIVTRPEKRNQQFGKSYGGYGDDDRYAAGGSVNFFHGDTRLSIIGLSNNVNQQNFSTQDLLGVVGNSNRGGGFGGGGGGGGRRGGGGGGGGGGFGGPPGGGQGQGGAGEVNNFLVGQQNGITSTGSVGTNYTDTWGTHLTVNQSYFFNYSDGQNDQSLRRQYVGTQDTNTFYNQGTGAESKNYNHRIDARMEYTMDSSNSFVTQPRLYFQRNNATNLLTGANTFGTGQLINQTDNESETNTSGYNLSDHLIYRHKFSTAGRTISLDLGGSANRKEGSGLLHSFTGYYQDSTNTNDTVNQQSPSLTKGYSLTSRLAYTEPVGSNGLLQFSYNPSYTKSTADNKKYLFDPAADAYTNLETRLSNTYENQYTTNNAGIGYRWRTTGLNFMTGVSYQIAALRGQQEFPFTNSVNKTFYNLLPNAMLTYNLSEHTNFRIFYRTSTSPPQISQLQNVVDNSNPLLLTTGNPDLKQSFNQSMVARYSATDVEDARALFIVLSVGYTNDYVGNATLTAEQDTVVARGIRLNRGTQLTYPVNLDGYWNARSFLTYSLPVDFISCKLNLTSAFTFTRIPGLINQSLNLSNTSVFSQGAVLSSNISEDVDFTVSYTGNYNISRNSFEPDLNNNYFNHSASVKLNVIFWEGVVFRADVNNTLYSGLSGGYNGNYVLWNMSLGKKLFSNQRGEIKASVADLLSQNKSINRTVTETYIEDTQNEVLSRYFMLTFTYTMR